MKGWIIAKVYVREVWLFNQDHGVGKKLLVMKKVKEGKKNKFKFSWSNFELSETTWEELSWMQGQRFWVEQAFRNGKTVLGMDDYQMRKWYGWYHHMALVMLAMSFLVSERIRYRKKEPLFTLAEVAALMAVKLTDDEDMINQKIRFITRDHERAKKAIQRLYLTG